MVLAIHDLIVLSMAVGSSALVSAVIHAYLPTLRRGARRAGDQVAHDAVAFITGILPENAFFRAAIAVELRALATQADVADATVSRTAADILARIAPQFPVATRNDVVEVLGDFTHAFIGGLASTTITGNPEPGAVAVPVDAPAAPATGSPANIAPTAQTAA
jgi:hypothetical protein